MKQKDTLQEDLIRIYGLDVFGLSEAQLDLLPGASDDLETVAELRALDRAAIAPLAPFLLIWMKDLSWPVSRELPGILLQYPHLMVSEIQTILSDEDDAPWHTHLIEQFVMVMPPEQGLEFRDYLVDMLENSDASRGKERTELKRAVKAALKLME